MRVSLRALAILLLLFLPLQPLADEQAAREPLTLFHDEHQAQQHCPADVVVWLNLPSGIYHFKGQRWYGRTKNGAFVCKKEADRTSGDRATRNGQ